MTSSQREIATKAAIESLSRLRDYALTLSAWTPLPGGVLLLADADGVLAQVVFGKSDLERNIDMSADRVFQIGSISKAFTAYVVAHLAEQGLFSLDDAVCKLLPWVNLGPDAAGVTVRQLLNHSGGLIMGADAWPDELTQIWKVRNSPASAPATAHFHYSNVGYGLAGWLAAEITGRSLPELVSEFVLTPLGMSESSGAITNDDRHRYAQGYVPDREDRPWVPGDALARATWFECATGDGNIGATAEDLAKFLGLFLHGSQMAPVPHRIVELLGPGGEPALDVPGLPTISASRYGLGMNTEVAGGHALLTHGGGMVGYSTFHIVDRTIGAMIIVLTNANGDNLQAQQLARLGHADFLARIENQPLPPFPEVDPTVATGDPDVAPGRYHSSRDLFELATSEIGEPVVLTHNGVAGKLFRTPQGRYVSDVSALRRFHLDRDQTGAGWIHGPDWYTLEPGRPKQTAAPSVAGQYRCNSPWYPTLRVYERASRLFLAAPGGVEAPDAEIELVEVTPGVYRVGAEEWLPERISAGPIVAGRVIWLDRDGLIYSRSFQP